MKEYGLRFLYKHLGKALKKLPFKITRNNKTVGVVISWDDFLLKQIPLDHYENLVVFKDDGHFYILDPNKLKIKKKKKK